MFDKKYAYHYLFAIGVITAASYFGDKIKQGLTNDDAENELIRKYLLNESPLYGLNRPKLWIHSTYEKNARQWKDFYSRNTTDLNQPYVHLCIKSIINHCGSDFNICLIDDETFSKLIPTWDINMSTVSEPHKSTYREIGMLQLLYLYGGIVVPNSFVCTKNLMPLYAECSEGHPFVSEEINRTCNVASKKENHNFMPSLKFMGGRKACPELKKMLSENKLDGNRHFTVEPKFLGNIQQWLYGEVNRGAFSLVNGKLIGTKTTKGKQILLDDLMSENFLDLDKDAYGIYIPADEILSRPKYQWFAYLSSEEVMKTNAIIVKYLKSSAIDAVNEYFSENMIKSVASI
jgi:hypothetical protein